jgi:hypothetical protein
MTYRRNRSPTTRSSRRFWPERRPPPATSQSHRVGQSPRKDCAAPRVASAHRRSLARMEKLRRALGLSGCEDGARHCEGLPGKRRCRPRGRHPFRWRCRGPRTRTPRRSRRRAPWRHRLGRQIVCQGPERGARGERWSGQVHGRASSGSRAEPYGKTWSRRRSWREYRLCRWKEEG